MRALALRQFVHRLRCVLVCPDFGLATALRLLTGTASANFSSAGIGFSPAAFHSPATTAFATIPRSLIPACCLRSRANSLSGSVRLWTPSLRAGFEACPRRDLHPKSVFRSAFQRRCSSLGLHSPLGRRPAGSKRSTAYCYCEFASACRFRPPRLIVP